MLLGQSDRNAVSNLIFHESKERRLKLYSAVKMNPKYITHLTGRTSVGLGGHAVSEWPVLHQGSVGRSLYSVMKGRVL